jgi:hypothetical protein
MDRNVRHDPLFLLFEIAAFETALYSSFLGFVLLWDWHFGFPFAFTQIVASGALRVDGLFGLGPVFGATFSWVIISMLFLAFANPNQSHVNFLFGVFFIHAIVTSFFGLPFNATWWFANTLGWLIASLFTGSVRLCHRVPFALSHS